MAKQGAYALLADAATIQIRPARQEDYDAVRAMHAAMSADHLYLRFFTVSKLAPDQEARRVCLGPAPDHATLLAVLDGEVIGCGTFERGDADCGSAEIAPAVADGMHGLGGPQPGDPRLHRADAGRDRPMLRVFAGAVFRCTAP